MKKMVFCLLLAPALGFGQKSGLSTPIPFGSYGFINGKTTFSHPDFLEEGTYLFPAQPVPANVTLKNGRRYENIKIMINLLDNEMIFTDSIGNLYTASTPVSSVEFLPSELVASRVLFKTGFPPTEAGGDETTFYEILADGEMTLARQNKIDYTDRQVLGRSMPTRTYTTQQTLYVIDKNVGMKKLSKNKSAAETIFAGNSKMSAYMKTHRIKSDEDLVGLVNYYNMNTSNQ